MKYYYQDFPEEEDEEANREADQEEAPQDIEQFGRLQHPPEDSDQVSLGQRTLFRRMVK